MALEDVVVRPVRDERELDDALTFIRAQFPEIMRNDWRGPRYFHERLSGYRDLMIVAHRGGDLVGVGLASAEPDGRGGLDHLAVRDDFRGRGLGRLIVAAVEDGARSVGVRQFGLGSLDGAVGFYEAVGFRGKLLVQFTGSAARVADVRALFAEFDVFETQWRDIPQLWVQTTSVDMSLLDRVRGLQGVHGQWIMEKELEAAE